MLYYKYLTHEFVYDNNCHTKSHVLNLMHFQGEIIIFFLKNKAPRRESVN